MTNMTCMPPIHVIELWPLYAECWICDEDCPHEFGVAVYEDLIMPDDYEGEWFGSPVCKRCYDIVLALQSEHPHEMLTKREVRRLL